MSFAKEIAANFARIIESTPKIKLVGKSIEDVHQQLLRKGWYNTSKDPEQINYQIGTGNADEALQLKLYLKRLIIYKAETGLLAKSLNPWKFDVKYKQITEI